MPTRARVTPAAALLFAALLGLAAAVWSLGGGGRGRGLHAEGFEVDWAVDRPAATRVNCPTRNQSYDLRGEAAFPRRTLVPFQYSTIGPEDPRECVFRAPLVV